MEMLNAVLSVNETQPGQVRRILEMEAGALAGKRVLLLGLAFKPETDDGGAESALPAHRGRSPWRPGPHVTAHDPIATANFHSAPSDPPLTGSTSSSTGKEALGAADIVVIATRWAEYAAVGDLAGTDQILFDARRLLPKEKAGSNYLTIGRRLNVNA